MERGRLSEDQAGEVLRRHSPHNDIRLREVARQLCALGRLP
ncbi:ANTAR domain-containing protein [Streptomyces sp. Z26]|nr:ANTAR domain-containing protein [Streptomyces sp. Z26]RLL70061.1 ANTAR domain-containing protein [Streptomyces sp. Z26]